MNTLEAAAPTYNLARPMDLLQNRLPSTQALGGDSIVLELDDGGTLRLAFAAETVDWTLTLDGQTDSHENPYDAVEMRPGIFFVDFVAPGSERQLTVVIDRAEGRAIVLLDDLLDGADGRALRQTVLTARISGTSAEYVAIERTRDLLGRRLYCEYSDEAAIEHIYANTETLVWQWLAVPIPALLHEVGVETGWIWKVAEELYLLHCRGDGAMTLILLLDLEHRRNVGRLFGEGAHGLLDERCGAKLTLLGRFDYPEHHQPA